MKLLQKLSRERVHLPRAGWKPDRPPRRQRLLCSSTVTLALLACGPGAGPETRTVATPPASTATGATLAQPPPPDQATTAREQDECVGWFTEKDVQTEPGTIKTDTVHCLKKCPFAPVPLPWCAEMVGTRTDYDVVTVTGTLTVSEKGKIKATGGCPEGYCCERHGRRLLVRPSGGPRFLLGMSDWDRLPCKGDQSRFCCTVETGVRVLVRGLPDKTDDPDLIRLNSFELCKLPQTAPAAPMPER